MIFESASREAKLLYFSEKRRELARKLPTYRRQNVAKASQLAKIITTEKKIDSHMIFDSLNHYIIY